MGAVALVLKWNKQQAQAQSFHPYATHHLGQLDYGWKFDSSCPVGVNAFGLTTEDGLYSFESTTAANRFWCHVATKMLRGITEGVYRCKQYGAMPWRYRGADSCYLRPSVDQEAAA
jgi:hypothetical protein